MAKSRKGWPLPKVKPFIKERPPQRLILAEWVDSSTRSRWHALSDHDESDVTHIFSVGFLIAETVDSITLAPHLSAEEGGDVDGCMTIPRVCILAWRELKPP